MHEIRVFWIIFYSGSTITFYFADQLFNFSIRCRFKKTCSPQVPRPILFGAKLICAGVVIVVAAYSSGNVGIGVVIS